MARNRKRAKERRSRRPQPLPSPAPRGAAPPAGSRATDEQGSGFISRLLTDEILTRVQRLKPVAEQAGLTLAQLAVAWTLQNPNVSAAIVGATRPEQVDENVAAADLDVDPQIFREMDDILAPVAPFEPYTS